MVHRATRSTPEDRCTAATAIHVALLAAAACGCLGQSAHPPDAWVLQESCNGIDDDEDGTTDEVEGSGQPCPPDYRCRDPGYCRCARSHILCRDVCYARTVATRTAVCDGACAVLDIDGENCGACGLRCAANARCQEGRCVCQQLDCNGVCTRPDAENCGACGRRCPPGAVCEPLLGYACQCPPYSLPCGPGGACVPFSDENCWACGGRCPVGTRCTGASCAAR